MRLQGKITRWNDERGFGFIAREGDDRAVFVHIKSFIGKSRRPIEGDTVFYKLTKGNNGKPRAEKVRYSDRPSQRSKPSGKRQDSLFPVFYTLLFLCLISVLAYFQQLFGLVIGAYGAASLLTFLVYRRDKSAARQGDWRTSEATLHFMGLVCGWPGGLAAQRLLRHKSSKPKFLFVFWITVILNQTVVGYLVWRGDTVFIHQIISDLREYLNYLGRI